MLKFINAAGDVFIASHFYATNLVVDVNQLKIVFQSSERDSHRYGGGLLVLRSSRHGMPDAFHQNIQSNDSLQNGHS